MLRNLLICHIFGLIFNCYYCCDNSYITVNSTLLMLHWTKVLSNKWRLIMIYFVPWIKSFPKYPTTITTWMIPPLNDVKTVKAKYISVAIWYLRSKLRKMQYHLLAVIKICFKNLRSIGKKRENNSILFHSRFWVTKTRSYICPYPMHSIGHIFHANGFWETTS